MLRRTLCLLPLLLACLVACDRGEQISIEILAHPGVTSLKIGEREIDAASVGTELLGIRLPAGDYDVSWKSDGRSYVARVSVVSNADNYLLLIEKEPWLEVDGALTVLEAARLSGDSRDQ